MRVPLVRIASAFPRRSCANPHPALSSPCVRHGSNVAPEILDPNLDDGDGYGPEVDLWSVGVILYSMLCGFPPFFNESSPALIRLIRTANYKFHSP